MRKKYHQNSRSTRAERALGFVVATNVGDDLEEVRRFAQAIFDAWRISVADTVPELPAEVVAAARLSTAIAGCALTCHNMS